MLFREIVTVYCDNTEHANTLRGQNSESLYVKAGGTYSNRLAAAPPVPLRVIPLVAFICPTTRICVLRPLKVNVFNL
jgi:hypothetical protein